MDRFDTLGLFVRIAETGSFSRAAESCGISRASATERIAGLEKQLNARLLNRNRRNVSLTPEGNEFLEASRRILAELDAIRSTLGGRAEKPSGQLRVSLNTAVGRCIILPKLAEFQAANTDIRLEIVLTDARSDFVQEGIDVAIRIGGLEDQDLVVRTLGKTRRVTVASPAYLARHGYPASPADIGAHQTIDFLLPRARQRLEWEFGQDGRTQELHFSGALALNDGIARVEAAAAGLGIAQTLAFVAEPFLKEKRLVRLFPKHEVVAPPISALYAPTRQLPARTKSFIEFASKAVKAACKQ